MMPLFFSSSLFVVFAVAVPAVASAATIGAGACRYIPGDAGWPRPEHWSQLNSTVGGRLIPTVPLASVCHQTGPFAAYDFDACNDLGTSFQDAGPQTMFVNTWVCILPDLNIVLKLCVDLVVRSLVRC